MDDASYFLVIRLGPKTSECEKNVTVVCTATGCDVTNCATTLRGFNKLEVNTNNVFARYLPSSRLWSWFTRRTRGWVFVSWNTFVHKILRKFFQPFWQIKRRVSPYGLVVSIIIVVIFRFLAVHATCLPRLSHPYSHFLFMRDAM